MINTSTFNSLFGGGNTNGTTPGLVFYKGGIEKTPTGQVNAFAQAGLTPEQINSLAKAHGLRTDSNLNFQSDLKKLALSTPEGAKKFDEIMTKYGGTKAGKFEDANLGARTFEVLKAVTEKKPVQNDWRADWRVFDYRRDPNSGNAVVYNQKGDKVDLGINKETFDEMGMAKFKYADSILKKVAPNISFITRTEKGISK